MFISINNRAFTLVILFVFIFSFLSFGQTTKETKDTKTKDPIAAFGPEDIDILLDLTYSDNYKIAAKAVYRLGELKAKKAFDRLISIFLFSGPSVDAGFDEVILASIWSLGEIGDPRAVDPLIDNYFRFTSTPYRAEIIRAVSKITNSDKVYTFLERTIRATQNNVIAYEVVKAFARIKRLEAIKVLSEILDQKKFEKWVNDEIEKTIKLLSSGESKESKENK
jgi:HEAT repeat protein